LRWSGSGSYLVRASDTRRRLSYGFGGVLAPLTATAAVRNLFNRSYQESIGSQAPPAWFLIGLRCALPLV
jgi:outer membrane receptor protein involved in Fe transport